jgi:DNA-directed RNA polymerase specialized sigma24 family protein
VATEQTANSIASSLALLARVSVLQFIDGKERSDQLKALDRLGFKHAEIADMLDMKPNTVGKALRRLKERPEAPE